MIPHKSIVIHRPPDSYGDCLRAAIASLLNVSHVAEVPHFMASGDDETGDTMMKNYLAYRGYLPFRMAVRCSLDDLFAMMAGVNRGIEYLLFCQCGGDDHVVICKDDKIIHDPALYVTQISGPPSTMDGMWVVMVMVPINPS